MKKTSKRDTNNELSQNRTEKQSMSSKTTVNWLFTDQGQIFLRGRGGDLVTCHSLFSDMTLQSQILVIESLFLTSVSKFIRKYLLSDTFQTCTPLALIPLLSLSNLATIFFGKNYR